MKYGSSQSPDYKLSMGSVILHWILKQQVIPFYYGQHPRIYVFTLTLEGENSSHNLKLQHRVPTIDIIFA